MVAALTLVVGLDSWAASALAADEGDKRAAQEQFQEGQRAFAAGDFRRAAAAFEEAYRKKPHHSPLWNAARSWQKAGESTRAANRYSRYLREAPPNAPDRDQATTALAQLATKVGLIVVLREGAENVRVDAVPLDGDSIYVAPGEHVVEGTFSGAPSKRVINIEAGSQLSVALERPAPTPTETRPAVVVVEERSGIPWTAVLVGGALTVFAGGFTIWSGIDTNAKRADFDEAPSQEKLDDGRSRQLRTNIALGATVGLAVLTATAALFVDWKAVGKKTARRQVWAHPFASTNGGGVSFGGQFP